MPTYTYVCGCRLNLDIVRPIAERDDLPECPRCLHGRRMTRKLAAPFFRFAGADRADQFTADALGMRAEDLPAALKRDA